MCAVLSHVDLRVRDRKRSAEFYAAFFAPLGIVLEDVGAVWTSFVDSRNPTGAWLAFTEEPTMVAGSSRVAFAASSRDEVDRVAVALASIGALDVEGPIEAYGPRYYAVFFADPDGNKLEVCHVTSWASKPGSREAPAAVQARGPFGF